MKFSYKWLQEFFDEPLPEPKDLGELLTFHSFELEGIEEVNDDYVIDVDVLPNRSSDCLSHRGIARELGTLLDKQIKDPYVELPTGFTDESLKSAETISLSIDPDSKCRRAMKRLVVGVEIEESPDWLKERLAVFGQRSINNVVDITNYITLYLGQPVHAFDYDKLAGEKKEITIRAAKEGEELETLDGHKVTLDPSIAVIADSKKALDIAGVKGGANSGIDENTKNVVLSVSNFDPVAVRRASRKLKIQTDASVRFQNDPSAELNAIAMEYFSNLMYEFAEGTVSHDVLDEYPIQRKNLPVSVSTDQINGLLGTNLKTDEVIAILDRLGFEHEEKGGVFEVVAPFERTDINIAEDIIEEVGRVNGYEKLEAKVLPDIGMQPEIHKEFYYADKIRNILNATGFSEIYGYTFRNTGDFEAIAAMASDKAFLRTNLQSGMYEYLEMNAKNAPLFNADRIRIFEIGTVFPENGEHKSLCIGISGKKASKMLSETQDLLESELGEKIPIDLKENMLEINFTQLVENLPDPKTYESFEPNYTEYKQFSLYPFVLRDIAVWVPESVTEKDLVDLIEKESGDLLVRTDPFDRFEKDGRISYAFHLVYQSMDRTLTDEEVGEIMDRIAEKINSQNDWEVR